MKKIIEVVYKGNSITFHPKLGRLVPEIPFMAGMKDIDKYIKSGLLKKIEKKEKNIGE